MPEGFDTKGLQDYLNTDDGKTWFRSVASAAGFKTPDEIETEKAGVARKNGELIAREKELKTRIAELESQGETLGRLTGILKDAGAVDDAGAPDYDRLQDALEKLRSPGGDASNVQAQEVDRELKRSRRDLEQTKKEVSLRDQKIKELATVVSQREATIGKLLIEDAFRRALANAGYPELVIPSLLPGLRLESKAQLQHDETTGDFSAVTDDGRSIEEWVKLWKDTDAGKALRPGAVNLGGGSRGSGGGGSPTKSWSEMKPVERAELFRKNPELYRKLRDQARGPK